MGQAAVPRTILQAMEATNRLFSEEVVRNKQIAKLDSVYTEDGAILPPDNPIIRGRENIKQFWSKVILEGGLTDAPLTTVEAEMLGDAATRLHRAIDVSRSERHIANLCEVYRRLEAGGRLLEMASGHLEPDTALAGGARSYEPRRSDHTLRAGSGHTSGHT